jgi:hypothetical protein
MFKFSYNFPGSIFSNSQANEFKLAKIGIAFIFLGIILYLLKELLIGLISFILFIIGAGFLFKAFKVWRSNNQIHIK